MARLWQCGFELGTTTAGVEFDSISGTPAVQTSIVRNGARALNTNVSATTAFITYQYAGASNTNNTYVRAYVYFASFPATNTSLVLIRDSVNGNNLDLRFSAGNTLIITNEQSASTQVGVASGSMQLNTWYRVELAYTYTSGAVQAYLALGDGAGALFANGTANASIGSNTLRLGVIDSATANIYWDDLAINDQTGSSQTNIPGAGAILHLQPSASGDSNGFTVGVGGTAGTVNNFTRVDEIIPDDATSYNGAALLNAEDLFNCVDFTGGAFRTINVVAVGIRCADLISADASLGVKLEIMKTSGGTKAQSANIIPNSTVFITNSTASPRSYPLVTYNDPDGNPWGQSTLDSMQIGYIEDTTGIQTMAVSTVWASVDFMPVLYGTTTSTSFTTSTSISSTSTSSTSSSISTTSTSTSASTTSTSLSITTLSTSSTSSSISSTSISSTSSSTSVSSTSTSISSTSVSSTSQSSTSSSTSISSTSSSISSTSSSASSTSHSISSTSASSTSSSSSTSTTTLPPPYYDYTYQDKGNITVTQIFTPFSPTSWTCPTNVTSVLAQCWGAGGGAGGSNGTTGGSGGGGGGFSSSIISVIPGTIYSLQVGIGGAGGVSAAGSAGTDTWFQNTSIVLAKGGGGGGASGGTPGAGGLSSLGVGTNTQTGGTGGTGTSSPSGGGGGGGAGPNQDGNTTNSAAAGIGVSLYGGTGGVGTLSGGSNPGKPFGGGGAGTGTGTTGGAGAGGGIQLTYTTNPQSGSTDLSNQFNAVNYGNVSTDDGDYFIERGSRYMIREYKAQHPNNTDSITMTWKGRSTLSTLVSPILIQIFNQNSGLWETLANQTLVPADTDFQVAVSQTTNVSNYYDSNNVVTFRSYQLVV